MKIISFIRKNTLFMIGTLLYIMIVLLQPQMIKSVAYFSWIYFKELFEILPLILLLATVIDAWIPKEVILKKLGKDSGRSGYFYAYLIGSISAGPIYASFPIVRLLMDKGASVGNAVIIISSWAVIKIPMLINEVKFLGVNFMLVRWVLTILAIFIMSRIIQKTISRDEIISQDSGNQKPLIEVVETYCIGCGLCTKLSPNDFEMIGDKARIKEGYQLGPTVKNASNKCPTQAIKINH